MRRPLGPATCFFSFGCRYLDASNVVQIPVDATVFSSVRSFYSLLMRFNIALAALDNCGRR
jgi:hypothetical protein